MPQRTRPRRWWRKFLRSEGWRWPATTPSPLPRGGAAMVAAAHDEFVRLYIVVNNAGILRDKSFGKLTPDLVDPVIDVHLRGAFHVLIPAWAHITEATLSAETVRDRLDQIFDTDGAFVPRHLGDEMKQIIDALDRASA